MNPKDMRDKLILALDVDTLAEAKSFVDTLYPVVKTFKVGPVLFLNCGLEIIDFIREKGADVFLDLKFHDIPNTVRKAVVQAVRMRVKMLTLHISGGEDMIRAAVEGAMEESRRSVLSKPLILGVTVLTSSVSGEDEILRLARLGVDRGLDGVVCSAREARSLRESIRKDFVIVTPGIRPEGGDKGDQKRTATAKEAISAGSDFLVVGRPILEAKDPLAQAQSMLDG